MAHNDMKARVQPRTLGRGDIMVSPLGLGCWAIGGPFWSGDQPLGWGEVDDDESIRAIHRALDLGVTLFDTADVYGTGHSERILGKALAGHRDRVVIATKWGNVFDPRTRQLTGEDATPAYLRRALQASLERLDTDYVDLYQLHLGGLAVDQALPLRAALEELVTEGLIRSYAWSTDDPERAAAFAEGPHCAAVQHELSVLRDAPEMLAMCERTGLTSLNRGPLGMGLLTGRFTATTRLAPDDVRGREPEWLRYFRDGRPAPEWLARIAAVRDVLTSDGRTPAQGAIAWIWARSPQTVPIPGFRTVAKVEQNVGALAHGPLRPEQVAEIADVMNAHQH